MKLKIAMAAALLAGACSPRLYPPETAVPDRYVYSEGFSQDTTGIGSRWWEMFGDPTLDTLVARALERNRDLAAAAARVEQARANLGVVRAQYLPQIGFGVQAGGASAWALEGMRLSLAAEVATTYFTLLEYERNLSIARRTLQLRRESAALIDSMFRYGMSDGVALEQARSLVRTAEADIPQYRRAVVQTALSLGTLLGELPAQDTLRGEGLPLRTDTYPAEIPVGLPSELLRRRPDIREAHYGVAKAAAQAGQARSARFPSISLTAGGGAASGSIKGLTSGDPWVWNAAGALVEPLVAFGKLRRAEQAAVAAYDEAARNYEQTVLTAFADVEKALTAITTCREQTERSRELVESNGRIATMTRALYRSGLSDYLDVIDAERSLYQSQMQLASLVAQQYINYVALCKALGGGWERPSGPPEKVSGGAPPGRKPGRAATKAGAGKDPAPGTSGQEPADTY